MNGSAPGRGIVVLLAAVAALGSLATQLLVPALPHLAHDLNASPADAQLVIGIFLIGLGGGQLCVGPLADRIGRKRVLVAGLGLYGAASAAASLATGLPWLLAARLAQALGASAGIVTARVLVNDLFPRDEAARRQATLMAVVLVSPALAPAIGGAISEWSGWRSLFLVLAVAGMLAMPIAWKLIPEPRLPSVRAERAKSLLGDLAAILRNRRFQGAAGALGCGSGALYIFLGSAPFLFARVHGLSAHQIGWCMMAVAAASIGGTFTVRRVDAGGNGLRIGAGVLVCAGIALIAAAEIWPRWLPALIAPMMLLGLGAGIVGPCGIARVMRTAPGREATAISLAGALQMLVSALAQYLFARSGAISPQGLGLAIGLMAGICLFSTIRAGSPPRSAEM